MREKEIGEGDSHDDGEYGPPYLAALYVWLPLMMLA